MSGAVVPWYAFEMICGTHSENRANKIKKSKRGWK